jgi:hypothetical protein
LAQETLQARAKARTPDDLGGERRRLTNVFANYAERLRTASASSLAALRRLHRRWGWVVHRGH